MDIPVRPRWIDEHQRTGVLINKLWIFLEHIYLMKQLSNRNQWGKSHQNSRIARKYKIPTFLLIRGISHRFVPRLCDYLHPDSRRNVDPSTVCVWQFFRLYPSVSGAYFWNFRHLVSRSPISHRGVPIKWNEAIKVLAYGWIACKQFKHIWTSETREECMDACAFSPRYAGHVA